VSYSFSVTAPDSDAAMAAVQAELEKVVQTQPIHVMDMTEAHDATSALIEVLDSNADKDVKVSVSGSLSWHGDTGKELIQAASLQVSVSLADRAAAAAQPDGPAGSDQGGA
jgi:hypothetical protein